MIGYTTIGTRDMEKATAFYTELLADMGCSLVLDGGRIAFIGKTLQEPCIAVCIPYDEKDPDPGNGNMIALNPGSMEMVDKLHAKALELGATNDGDPGWRVEDVFYGGYFLDLDGNKACFFQFGF